MNSKHVKEFIVFADCLNYTEAAKRCFVSPPTLTAHISELEAEIGATLVQKAGAKLSLTPAGKTLASEGDKLLACVDDIIARCTSVAKSVAHITVAANGTTELNMRIANAVAAYRRAYPGKSVQITSTTPFEMGASVLEKSADTDIAMHLLFGAPGASQERIEYGAYCARLLYTQGLSFLVPPANPLYDRDVLTADDLQGATVLYAAEPSWRANGQDLVKQFSSIGIDIHLSYTNVDSLLEYMLSDNDSAIRPMMGSVVDQMGASIDSLGRVVRFDGPVIWNLYALYRKGADQSVIDFVNVLAGDGGC